MCGALLYSGPQCGMQVEYMCIYSTHQGLESQQRYLKYLSYPFTLALLLGFCMRFSLLAAQNSQNQKRLTIKHSLYDNTYQVAIHTS